LPKDVPHCRRNIGEQAHGDGEDGNEVNSMEKK